MKTRRHNTAAFTLAEVLVAAALSGIVAAIVLTLLVNNMGLWRDGMARLQLSEQSRIVRERVLHGINGPFGLRHAHRSQITATVDQIIFKDVSSSNKLTLFWPYHQPPSYIDQAGTHSLCRSGAFLENVAIASTGNILTIDFSLALTNGGKKITQPQQIRVYLLND